MRAVVLPYAAGNEVSLIPLTLLWTVGRFTTHYSAGDKGINRDSLHIIMPTFPTLDDSHSKG
jgi:hypothetical protein